MQNIILFDDPEVWQHLLPLTFTRPISEIRVGILTIKEKWQKYFPNASISYATQDYLQEKYPLNAGEDNIFINSRFLPNAAFVERIQKLSLHEALNHHGELVVLRTNRITLEASILINYPIPMDFPIIEITYLWDIFAKNGDQIRADFHLLTQNRTSAPILDKHTVTYNLENIFLEEGVNLKACILNAENGPIYIGKNAQIQEGSIIQGPFALCDNAVVNIGGKMRGDTTIGPFCKVGGEINNSVILGYSNKAHDGFLGNAVIGEWCNLGAATNNSNLKNNYSAVKVWNYVKNDFINTEKQFCGLFMGDYSKAGINTMFNTGSVVGVSCNVFGGDFLPKFIPSFSWGNAQGFERYDLEKALEAIEVMMQRRNVSLSAKEIDILTYLFNQQYA